MQKRGVSKSRSDNFELRSSMTYNFFLPGLLAHTEMAQRSTRRFLNLISVEVFQDRLAK